MVEKSRSLSHAKAQAPSVFAHQRRWRRHPKGGIYGPKYTKFPTEVMVGGIHKRGGGLVVVDVVVGGDVWLVVDVVDVGWFLGC